MDIEIADWGVRVLRVIAWPGVVVGLSFMFRQAIQNFIVRIIHFKGPWDLELRATDPTRIQEEVRQTTDRESDPKLNSMAQELVHQIKHQETDTETLHSEAKKVITAAITDSRQTEDRISGEFLRRSLLDIIGRRPGIAGRFVYDVDLNVPPQRAIQELIQMRQDGLIMYEGLLDYNVKIYLSPTLRKEGIDKDAVKPKGRVFR